jgi:HEAT repeat protein
MSHQLIRKILFHAGKEMRKIEVRLRRSRRTQIISLGLILGMMGATILPALAKGQVVRASKHQNAIHLAQFINPPRPVPTPGELTKLINYLNHKDLKVRLWAIQKLGIFGPGSVAALPKLISFLQDTDAEVRWNAASALGKIGPGAKAAVPQLMPLLQDNNASVREIAAYALGEIGSEAKAVVPQLISLLRDGDKRVRLTAILALGKLKAAKETVPQIIPLLQDPDEETRIAAVKTLEDLGPATVQEALPFLIKSYYRYEDRTVFIIIRSAGGSKAIPKMIANLPDNNTVFKISELVFHLYGGCDDYTFNDGDGDFSKVMTATLVDHFKDKKSPDRAAIAYIIGKIFRPVKSAAPALIAALNDRDEDVRHSAVGALQRIDVMALRQALIANLQHQDQDIRRTAIEEVQLLTKDIALINALQDKDENIRQRAIKDLLTIKFPDTPAIWCALAPTNSVIDSIQRIFRRR